MADPSIPRDERLPRKVTPRPLGFGEFDDPANSSAMVGGQIYFFHVIKIDAVDVVRQLAGAPFSQYREVRDAADWQALGWDSYPDFLASRDYRSLLPALRDWATRWRLTDDWCVARALQTLDLWALMSPKGRGLEDLLKWGWDTNIGNAIDVPLTDEEIENTMVLPRYEPNWNFLQDTIEAMTASFIVQRDAYIRRVEDLMHQRGWKRKKVLRRPEHFEWLVRYHVLGESTKAIAPSVPPNASKTTAFTANAVYKAITSTADLIGLTLRRRRDPVMEIGPPCPISTYSSRDCPTVDVAVMSHAPQHSERGTHNGGQSASEPTRSRHVYPRSQ